REYIVALVAASRSHQHIYLGASPRGSLALFHASQAYAALEGERAVLPDHVKRLVKPTLSHRLIWAPAARVRRITAHRGAGAGAVRDGVVAMTAVPGGPASLSGSNGHNGRR